MSERKMFVFVNRRTEGPTAYAKVAVDIVRIVRNMGFRPLTLQNWPSRIRGTTRLLKLLWWFNARRILRHIRRGDVVLLQYPDEAVQYERFGLPLLKWIGEKGAKLIVAIHDIDMPRFCDDVEHSMGSEFVLKVAACAHQLIVHNAVMRKWFVERGVSDDKMVELGVFDYLSAMPLGRARFSRDVVVAGNLSPKKALYAENIKEIPGVCWKVYSGYFDEGRMGGDNVTYLGTCPSDEFPSRLNAGFGLVWDGDSVDACSGNAGRYTMVVSPHKLSLYLTSALPVIVCEGSAISEFVLSNKVGLVVKSLRDLPEVLASITEESYTVLASNAYDVARRLRAGFYTQSAVRNAIERVVH